MRVDDPEQPTPARRRTARTGIQVGLWVAAAAGALLLGMTAVGSIGTGLGGGGLARPLAAEDIEARLAAQGGPAAPAAPAAPAPAAPAPAPRPAPPTVVPAGPAGTVLVRCDGATPRVVSVNPAQGFEVEDDPAAGQVELDGDDVTVAVTLSCADGVASGRVAVLADDD